MNNSNTVSIVIPTIGRENLKLTLNSIRLSNKEVQEVILVIPKKFDFYFELSDYEDLNLIILKTEKSGQVYQRVEGFKIATADFILQLDDDIEFDNNLICNLVNRIQILPEKSSIAPLLTNIRGESVYRKSFTKISRLFYALFYFDFFLKEGSINHFGKSIGIKTKNRIFEVDWLPGGCVIHKRSNLILEDYFPFQTKAFMEDLFHSYYLKRKGINLYLDSHVSANIIEPEDELYADRLINDKINEFKVRRYYFKLVGLNLFKFYWSCFIDFTIIILKYFKIKYLER